MVKRKELGEEFPSIQCDSEFLDASIYIGSNLSVPLSSEQNWGIPLLERNWPGMRQFETLSKDVILELVSYEPAIGSPFGEGLGESRQEWQVHS